MARAQRPSPYHLMSAADKATHALERQREPPVPCPAGCGTQLMAEDLLSHVAQRCDGPPEPGPTARWISWQDAIAAGVNERALIRWTQRQQVRFRGERGGRRYLLRDLALRVAQIRSSRRR